MYRPLAVMLAVAPAYAAAKIVGFVGRMAMIHPLPRWIRRARQFYHTERTYTNRCGSPRRGAVTPTSEPNTCSAIRPPARAIHQGSSVETSGASGRSCI